MKKRILAALMATIILGASTVMAFAENEPQTQEEETTAAEEVSTGTQIKAQEKVVDVDADIQSDIEATIPDEIEEITISNADEFMNMVRSCSLDTWSVNKKIVITEDISLVGKNFSGIPSFGGVFDGQGHTISDVSLKDKTGLSYVGFFTHVAKSARIMNLNVTGSIIPTGNTTIIGGFCGENSGQINGCSFKGVVSGKDYIGGIAGINQLTGDIRFCNSEGFISGTHFVGGVAGKNDGNISNCRNEALVNITNTDTEVTIDSMEKLNTALKLIKNGINKSDEEAQADVTVTDVGGIAGVSIGIISRCINNGDVGYAHVGYNIGGIAGRQSGYLYNCSNNGRIRGRKDIGGIVGQAEPYITIDFATDVAYQLQEAVAKLHDTVSATLLDTKNQSDVLTARLAVISKFTGQAVEDTRYIAGATVDFANGVSGAATEALSRVEYVMQESSKDGGPIDNASNSVLKVQSSASNINKTINDLDISNYLAEGSDEKQQYNDAKVILASAAAQYEAGVKKSNRTYYNMYISEAKGEKEGTSDLKYFDVAGNVVDESSWTDADMDTNPGAGADTSGTWKHDDGFFTEFPITNTSDERTAADEFLNSSAKAFAASASDDYARDKYINPFDETRTGSYCYDEDIRTQSAVIAATYSNHLFEMSETTRKDAQSAITDLEAAAGNLGTAGKQTKSIISDVAGRGAVAFPQFSSEYKEHTASLADNLAAMNDNFGLLNSEMNGATGVLVSDLSAVNDQFNNILTLYTDALDGVLEKDYTNVFNDDSLKDAKFTTDATIDSCFNFGICEGDIDVSGIAGTMAIEYDFDKESDVTSLKDSGINASYLTKCVLRDDRNYGDIRSQKNYSGGICGRQDMGTILNCGSYSRVTATEGNYVGGVAGSSISYIVESYAKGELEGKSYVGGIVGEGKNISDCLSMVSIEDESDWSGAIAGHISEAGEVRGNFFVSDELAGIDRVSYALKAEPVSYDNVRNNKVFVEIEEEIEEKEKQEEKDNKKNGTVIALSTAVDDENTAEPTYRELPYEFSNITVSFVLDDEESDDTVKLGRVSKKYEESICEDEYPAVAPKEGCYVDWDIEKVDSLKADTTITATYKPYRTTLAIDDGEKDIHQSILLVDGNFREEDKLEVARTLTYNKKNTDTLSEIEIINLKIPDDGQSTHQIRFKPTEDFYIFKGDFGRFAGGDVALYQITDHGRIKLEPSGAMGKYATYDLPGNEITLSYGVVGIKNVGLMLIAIVVAAFVLVIVIIIIIVNIIKRHGGTVPKIFNRFIVRVSDRLENKEQIFFDDTDKIESKLVERINITAAEAKELEELESFTEEVNDYAEELAKERGEEIPERKEFNREEYKKKKRKNKKNKNKRNNNENK